MGGMPTKMWHATRLRERLAARRLRPAVEARRAPYEGPSDRSSGPAKYAFVPGGIRVGRPVDGSKVHQIVRALARTSPSDGRMTSQNRSLVTPFISPTQVRAINSSPRC